jgi:hypothetical protein
MCSGAPKIEIDRKTREPFCAHRCPPLPNANSRRNLRERPSILPTLVERSRVTHPTRPVVEQSSQPVEKRRGPVVNAYAARSRATAVCNCLPCRSSGAKPHAVYAPTHFSYRRKARRRKFDECQCARDERQQRSQFASPIYPPLLCVSSMNDPTHAPACLLPPFHSRKYANPHPSLNQKTNTVSHIYPRATLLMSL